MRALVFFFVLFFSLDGVSANDSVNKPKRGVFDKLYGFFKEFSRVDTHYVEPQHYNFTVMLQNTNTYEKYQFGNKTGQSITLSPSANVKIGPYLGWRWVFLGYTLDLSHLSGSNNRKEYDLSLYSNQMGIDLFYKRGGDDYKVRELDLGEDVDTRVMKNVEFKGMTSSISGFNLYYIFNHRKFSYPAAFSQSTCQKISVGSPLVGIGYTRQSLDVDWNSFSRLLLEKLGENLKDAELDSSMQSQVKYTDISFMGGYAYNWVFARNWLFSASFSLALGYKASSGDTQGTGFRLRDFDFKNFNLDGVSRFGIVWNDTRWYAGASTVIHSYNYKKSQFRTNTTFGNLNIYVGFNFGKR